MMKSLRKHSSLAGVIALVAGLLLEPAPKLAAQTRPTAGQEPVSPTNNSAFGGTAAKFNRPPCDFNDNFYRANGIDVTELDSTSGQRFGLFRQTGPPARGQGQVNWVHDSTCSETDPTRTNVRILATTGGYIDDGTGAPTDFISLIAFLLNQDFFTGVANARDIQMVDIVGVFEAYAAPKQRLPDGTFALTPCGTMGDGTTPCFPVTSVATPQLRQDWRFATNRNSI